MSGLALLKSLGNQSDWLRSVLAKPLAGKAWIMCVADDWWLAKVTRDRELARFSRVECASFLHQHVTWGCNVGKLDYVSP